MSVVWRLRSPELDVDAEMRREAAHRLNLAADAEGMPDKARIAALSLAIWMSTDPRAAEAARVLLGHADEIEGREADLQACFPVIDPAGESL